MLVNLGKTLIVTVLLWSGSAIASCQFAHVQFTTEFEGARLDNCRMLDKQSFILTVNPENEPINPSPWYAFDVIAVDAATPLTLSIEATNAHPRYLPKISQDGVTWHPLEFTIVDNALQISLEATPQPQRIAAQPLFTSSDYLDWMNQPELAQKYQQTVIGKSVLGKDIHALIHMNENSDEWLILIGRQHPPELTGAFAALDFFTALSADSALQRQFFARFNILFVPLLNPDGVDAGHWRHNANGIDLNRDWGKFTQPETTAVAKFIESVIQPRGRIVFAVDFHSTQQDIFYTMPTDKGLVPATFSDDWLALIGQQRIRSFTMRDRPGSSPGRGVFKQYIADNFGVHAVTYEMGDNTPLYLIRHIATVSAHSLMQLMLDTEAQAFIPQANENASDASEALQ